MTSETLQRGKPYPLGDPLTREERERFGVENPQGELAIKAVWTGEKRPPKRGEWYLSGAIIAAYRAHHDLAQAYHIATLVRTRTRTITEIIPE